MAILILRLRLPSDDGEEGPTTRVLLKEAKAAPAELVRLCLGLARELAPGAGEPRLKYLDKDGDACTLTAKTVRDALCFVKPAGSDGSMQLDVTVHVVGENSHAKQSEDVKAASAEELPLSVPAAQQPVRAIAVALPLPGPAATGSGGEAEAVAVAAAPVAPLRVVRTFRRSAPVATATGSTTGAAGAGAAGERQPQRVEQQPAQEAHKAREEEQRAKEVEERLGEERLWWAKEVERVKAEQREAERRAQKATHQGEEARLQAEEARQQALQAKQDAEEAKRDAARDRCMAEEAARCAVEAADKVVCDASQAVEEATWRAEKEAKQRREADARAALSEQAACEAYARATAAEQAAYKARAQEEDARAGAADTIQNLKKEVEHAWKMVEAAEEGGRRREAAGAPARYGAAALNPAPSALVTSAAPLLLGIEAREDEAARGDATAELGELIEGAGARQAFRLGRAQLPARREAPDMPACASATIHNDGPVAWPETAALAFLSGDALGLPLLPLGPLAPGEATEVQLDLLLPARGEASVVRSAWTVADAATGTPFGPVLVFEASWLEE
mmetsp:Transcript_87998/g.249302  ORF Transcript_87998/g.249302 Transcript_87998/m.249302 type:complete len:565 (-) Transcript_87998:98-1792(-)